MISSQLMNQTDSYDLELLTDMGLWGDVYKTILWLDLMAK